MDYGFTLAGGVVALPLMVLVALLTLVFSGRPIFYKSERVGRGGRKFFAWKFRTMVPEAEAELEAHLSEDAGLRREWDENTKLKNDPRVTSLGLWLRRTGLDELPQLWNVLRRDMSLVGPRPLLSVDRAKYGETYALYTGVLPGLTGLWQVSGRSNTTYQERIRLDRHYLANWSPWMDLHLMLRTVPVVIRADGGY